MSKVSGACFRNAMRKAGYRLSTPDWIVIENIPQAIENFNLSLITGPITIELGIQPVIVLYETRPGKGHAEYVNDIGSVIARGARIIGIILL